MRWKSFNNSQYYIDKKKQWHKWFAWYPVVISKTFPGYSTCKHWAWFEWIERQNITYDYGVWNYEYRERRKSE